MLVRWVRDGGNTSHPFVRFVREGHARIRPETVHASVSALVESVLERVSDLPYAEVAQLRAHWTDLQQLTTDERNLYARAARLGVNAHYDELRDHALARVDRAGPSLRQW